MRYSNDTLSLLKDALLISVHLKYASSVWIEDCYITKYYLLPKTQIQIGFSEVIQHVMTGFKNNLSASRVTSTEWGAKTPFTMASVLVRALLNFLAVSESGNAFFSNAASDFPCLTKNSVNFVELLSPRTAFLCFLVSM